MQKIKFNISPSMLKVYKKSQIQFYYQYLEKPPEDTEVCQVYGISGQIVHSILEDYANGVRDGLQEKFKQMWYGKNTGKLDLRVACGLNGKPLDMQQYWGAVYNGVQILKKYKKLKTEEMILFPLINNETAEINIKGFIDLQILDNDEIKILDWKTSSSKDDDFLPQLKHYAYSVWRKYKILPSKAMLKFVKIDKDDNNDDVYDVKEEDLVEYEQLIKATVNEIIEKGFDKSKYEMGEWDNIFNPYKKACQKEANRRDNPNVIEILRNGAGAKIITPIDTDLIKMIVTACSYEKKNSHFIQINSHWDARVRLFNANKLTFPIGIKWRVEGAIAEYDKLAQKGYSIKYINNRQPTPDIKMPDKLIGVELRDYQVEAVEVAMRNE